MASSTCAPSAPDLEPSSLASTQTLAYDTIPNDLGQTIYQLLPSRTLDLDLSLDLSLPTHDLRTISFPQNHTSTSISPSKRKDTSDSPPGSWLSSTSKPVKRSRSRSRSPYLSSHKPKDLRMELHQSTCLNLDSYFNNGGGIGGGGGGVSTESDLWILPSLEEWELDSSIANLPPIPVSTSSTSGTSTKTLATRTERTEPPAEWAPLVSRAVHSNRERLRRRLEGDGWDFVGGKYGEDCGGNVLNMPQQEVGWGGRGEESGDVDEEFDVVVVLPLVAAIS